MILIDYLRIEQSRRLFVEFRVDKATVPNGVIKELGTKKHWKESKEGWTDGKGEKSIVYRNRMQWKEVQEGKSTYIWIRCLVISSEHDLVKQIKPLMTGHARHVYVDGMRKESVEILKWTKIDNLEVDISPLDKKAGEKLVTILTQSNKLPDKSKNGDSKKRVQRCKIRTTKFFIAEKEAFIEKLRGMVQDITLECPWKRGAQEIERNNATKRTWPRLQ